MHSPGAGVRARAEGPAGAVDVGTVRLRERGGRCRPGGPGPSCGPSRRVVDTRPAGRVPRAQPRPQVRSRPSGTCAVGLHAVALSRAGAEIRTRTPGGPVAWGAAPRRGPAAVAALHAPPLAPARRARAGAVRRPSSSRCGATAEGRWLSPRHHRDRGRTPYGDECVPDPSHELVPAAIRGGTDRQPRGPL